MSRYRATSLTIRGFKDSKERAELWNRFCRWSRMRGDKKVSQSLEKALTDAMAGWNGLPLTPADHEQTTRGAQ